MSLPWGREAGGYIYVCLLLTDYYVEEPFFSRRAFVGTAEQVAPQQCCWRPPSMASSKCYVIISMTDHGEWLSG